MSTSDSICAEVHETMVKCWHRRALCQVKQSRYGMRGVMGVSLIFKIAAVGILITILSQVLKHSGREEQAFLTTLAGLVLVLYWVIPYIKDLFQTIKDMFSL